MTSWKEQLLATIKVQPTSGFGSVKRERVEKQNDGFDKRNNSYFIEQLKASGAYLFSSAQGQTRVS